MRAETVIEEGRQDETPLPELKLRRGISPLAAARLALWRLGRGWRLLLAVGLGMLVAVTLICTVPLYSSLVSNVQLQHQLAIQSPSDRNIETVTTISPIVSTSVGQALDNDTQNNAQYFSSFAPVTTWFLAMGTFPPIANVNGQTAKLSGPKSLAPNPQLVPIVLNYSQALSHLTIISGRLPQPTAANQPQEIIVNQKMGLQPGDTISLSQSAGGITMKIVGVWKAKSVDDPYWNGNGPTFDVYVPPCHAPPSACPPTNYPVLFNRDGFFNAFGVAPNAPVTPGAGRTFSVVVHYISYTDPHRITAVAMPTIVNNIGTYRTQTNADAYNITGITDIGVATQLDNVLKGLQQQLSILAQPLYIVVAQVVGLALLFVMAMATLLIEAQAGDLATLKSRGASFSQLLFTYTLQGVLVAVLAALAGPFLAVLLSIAIIHFFVPFAASALQGTNLAAIASPQLVTQPALIGSLLGLATLIIAAWLAARRDVLAFRREQGRSSGAPFWKRYYLDIALVILCAAGYLELGEFGGLNIRQQLGQNSGGPDPFQLAAPALLLLGGALLALRLFPLATRVGAWLASRARGATGMLAFAQLDRASAQFSRLTLLLTLSVGIGVFALTFQTSIAANTVARSQFLVGCDQRVVLRSPVDGTPLTAPFQKTIAAMPGVENITPVYRSVATNVSDSSNAEVLGIDPTSFAQVAYWRSDYASQPLASLMQQMQANQRPGTTAGDQQHPIWALVDTNFAARYSLQPGVVFSLEPAESSSASLYFVVGATVQHFPTLSDSSVTGFVIANIADYAAALHGPQGQGGFINFIGPNEYWLHTNGVAADDAKRAALLQNPNLWVDHTVNLKTVEVQTQTDPLASGMTGLLLVGALIAALLAVIGSLIQSSVSARQRLTQFAILRTLGGQGRQLLNILLSQQIVVYIFSLAGGTLLGVLLSTATLPFLQFSTSTINTAERLPSYLLAINYTGTALFYCALVLAFVLALFVGAQFALRGGLGKTLRIGED
jgi:ABC-type lipoprotein release transport system permease subunit